MIWVKFRHNTRAAAGQVIYRYAPDSFKEAVESYEGNVAEAIIEEGIYKSYLGGGDSIVDAEIVDIAEVPEESIQSFIKAAESMRKYYTKRVDELKSDLRIKRLDASATPAIGDQNVMVDP